MRILVALLALTSIAHADSKTTAPELLEAITAKDVERARARVERFPITLSNLWFDTATCEKQFGTARQAMGTRMVAEDQFPALVDCLATLELAFAGTHTLRYEPGIRVFVMVKTNGTFTGFASDLTERLTLHLSTGSFDVTPDAATKAAVRDDWGVSAESAFCVTPKGTIENLVVTPREGSTAADVRYVKSVNAAARRWRFKPFIRKGVATRVCGRMRHVWENPDAIDADDGPPASLLNKPTNPFWQ